MKKVLGILLAVFLCLGIASTSMATGGVETYKSVMIFAGAMLCTDTAAESDAITLQGNIGTVDGASYIYHHGLYRTESNAAITGSASDNSGVVGVNQASGNLNNQGNTVSITNAGIAAEAQPASEGRGSRGRRDHGPKGALAHAVAFAFQGNITNGYFATKKIVNSAITDSANDNTGVAGVNNAAGSQNNQTNTVAIAAGLNTSIALGEATLAQTNMSGFVCNTASVNNALIDTSANANHGVVGVNNSSGAQNNQANVVAIAGNHP